MWNSLWNPEQGDSEETQNKRKRDLSLSPTKPEQPAKTARKLEMAPPRPLSPEHEALLQRFTETMNSTLDEKLKPITDIMTNVRTQVDEIYTELEGIRKQLLNKTLIVFGIPEIANEKFDDTEAAIQDLAKVMGISDLDIDNARRIGRPIGGKNRPIEVALVRQKDKYAILTAKSQLRNDPNMKNVYINPARTKLESRNFKKLTEFAKGHKATNTSTKFRIRNGRLELTDDNGSQQYGIDKTGKLIKIQVQEPQAMETSSQAFPSSYLRSNFRI